MPTGQHNVVKAQKIVDNAIVALGDTLSVAQTVTKESYDQFKGLEGDKLTFRVPGTLPVRSYGWRNDRQEPIRTDTYTETKVDVTVQSENDYSAVKIIDEALEWDFGGAWGKIFVAQIKAITTKIEWDVLDMIKTAPYEAQIVIDPTPSNLAAQIDIGRDLFFNAFSDAKALLVKMRCPMDGVVTALCGSNFAAELRKNQKLGLNQGTGNESAFANNSILVYSGISVVEDTHLDPDECFVYAKSGMLFFNAAPAIPLGAKQGAIQNQDGISLRWIQDYDPAYQIDRSTFSSWKGFRYVDDYLMQRNTDNTQDIISTSPYFLRGVKIVMKAGTYASAVGFVPGDAGSTANGRRGAAASSDLSKVFKGLPFTGSLPAGERYPNVLLTAMTAVTATATAAVSGGAVTTFTVTNAGGRYATAPAVTITGAGTGATAVATVVDGKVTAITTVTGGTGYSSAPTVAIAAP